MLNRTDRRRKMMPPHARSAAGYNEHHDEDDLEEDMQGERGHNMPIETT